jgi:hypothetical protein
MKVGGRLETDDHVTRAHNGCTASRGYHRLGAQPYLGDCLHRPTHCSRPNGYYDQQTESNTVDYLVWNLTWDDDTDEHIVEGFRGLSRQQTSAVDAFLRFIAAQSHDHRLAADAAKARQSYWAGAAG